MTIQLVKVQLVQRLTIRIVPILVSRIGDNLGVAEEREISGHNASEGFKPRKYIIAEVNLVHIWEDNIALSVLVSLIQLCRGLRPWQDMARIIKELGRPVYAPPTFVGVTSNKLKKQGRGYRHKQESEQSIVPNVGL